MHRYLVATVAALALGIGAASAADLAPQPAPVYAKAPMMAPAYNWTGFYVGGNVGAADGSFDPTTSTVFSSVGWFNVTSVPVINSTGAQSINPTGFTGGLEAGYNWQVSSFVLGVEGDIDAFNLHGSASTGPVVYPCCTGAQFVTTSSASTDWLATARGRVGIAYNNFLFFGTGGAAFTDLKGNFTFSDNCNAATCNGGPDNEAASISATKTGYAVGGGVEAGLWGGWSLKAEYLFVDFGTVSTTGLITPEVNGVSNANPFTHSIDLKANIGRVGVNYRF
jgi:outer membrane immunogenic protein